MKKQKATSKSAVRFIAPIIAVLLALVLGVLLIAALGYDVSSNVGLFVQGIIGNTGNFYDMLAKFSPLAFCALAYAIAFRSGVINIGGEGQLIMGGLCGGMVAVFMSGGPVIIHVILALIAGIIGGGLWGLLAGWLKVRFGANEIITTIMLNYIALYLINYMVALDGGPIRDLSSNTPQSAPFTNGLPLPGLDGSSLTIGIIIAIVALVVYYIFFNRMKAGFEMRVVGLNNTAAEYAGMKVKKNALLSMFLAGGAAGLGGVIELISAQQRILPDFSANYGFDGIAVALLGQLSAIGMFISTLLFAALKAGGLNMAALGDASDYIVNVIQALVIIFVVASVYFEKLLEKKRLLKSLNEHNIIPDEIKVIDKNEKLEGGGK